MASAVVGAGKSETLRAGCQEDEAGNAWAGAEATAHRQKFFLRKPGLGFAHRPFKSYQLLNSNLIENKHKMTLFIKF